MPRSPSSSFTEFPSFNGSFSRTVGLRVAVAFAGLFVATRPVRAGDMSFQNDVMAVLSKAGCNLGTCHGNARGKGGFQISLRGQDPSGDFNVLTRDWSSRRVNVSEPDLSLILLKPTQQIAHEGGKRFETDSAEYRVLRTWIAAGMPFDSADAPRLVKLTVTPREAFLVANHAAQLPVPSPPSSGERVRVRGPEGDDAAPLQTKSTLPPSPRRGGLGRGADERGIPGSQSSPLPSPPRRGEGTRADED